MKTKTVISELTHEDLVNLLCTATYGSSWLECDAFDRDGVDITENDCLEDVWAKCLLAGKQIACIDHNAYGAIYGHQGNAVESDDGDGSVCYLITLDGIVGGLEKCADGDFVNADEEGSWIAKYFRELQDGGYDLDQPEAEALMQIILFGEIIYG